MARRKSLDDEELTDTNFYILLALMEPLHGYAIMQKVKELSDSKFEIGPASLYTSLKKLTDNELLTVEAQNDKKIYKLTKNGISLLEKDFKRREALVECARRIVRERGDING